MKIYGMALCNTWARFPLPLTLLMLCMWAVTAPLHAKPSTQVQIQPAYRNIPAATQAKLDWLRQHGTPVKYKQLKNSHPIYMCRRASDQKAILARDWGLQAEIIYMDMVSCPEGW